MNLRLTGDSRPSADSDGVSAVGLRLLRLIGDTPEFMREMSVVEQRYEGVRAVIADDETVTAVAARVGVSRKPVPNPVGHTSVETRNMGRWSVDRAPGERSG